MRAWLPCPSSNCTKSDSLIISGRVPAIVTTSMTFFPTCILMDDYCMSSLYFYGTESGRICDKLSALVFFTNPCVVLVLAHDLMVNALMKHTNQYCENGRNIGI